MENKIKSIYEQLKISRRNLHKIKTHGLICNAPNLESVIDYLDVAIKKMEEM